MPFWKRKAPSFKDCGIRRSADTVRLELRAITGVLPQLTDAQFVPISRAWWNDQEIQSKLRRHFWELPRYTSQAWDCENFAMEFVQWVAKQAAFAGVDACPMAYSYNVKNDVPWAGVRDGYHAINLIEFDDSTLEVLEPQSIVRGMVHDKLSNYPNDAFRIYH